MKKIEPDYELTGTAEDGVAGLELIRTTNPDLVIMDIRMPRMDGLTMLKILREQQILCRVIVLSAYSDFDYAKQAIDLGIENYLLKPINILELRKVLRKAEGEIEKEQNPEPVYSIERIFIECMAGQIHPDEQFHVMTKQKYDFTVNDRAEVCVLWLGSGYTEQKKVVKERFDDIAEHSIRFTTFVYESDRLQLFLVVLYRLPEDKSMYSFFQKSVVPVFCGCLQKPLLFMWKEIDHILNLPEKLAELRQEMEWGLIFPEGTLIQDKEIDKIQTIPLKHPVHLEDMAKRALMTENRNEIIKIYQQLFEYYRQEPYCPSEIKKSIIRFNWSLIHAGGKKFADLELQIQSILQRIASAVSWEEINESMEEFFQMMKLDMKPAGTEDGETSASSMVQKAQQLVEKYYDQGITLEEIAAKLFVSEEYLSTQFKKETGSSFSETIRKYRIEKVKKLLLETHLKLNQIAELAGYSDPKYMSRVFRKVVGMLPDEYRKSAQ